MATVAGSAGAVPARATLSLTRCGRFRAPRPRMSYQFDDESALEELLNQQLDRRKQQTPGARFSQQTRPSTSTARNEAVPPATTTTNLIRPSTAISDRQDGLATSSSGRGRMSSWLVSRSDRTGAGRSEQVAGQEKEVGPTTLVGSRQPHSVGSRLERVPAVPRAEMSLEQEDQELFDEERLQEMSKQRLIQLILGEIRPRLAELRLRSKATSMEELERLKRELEGERRRVELVETRHGEEVKLIEQKWAQINRQLESRLELGERELAKSLEGQREYIEKLDKQQQADVSKLIEGYESRLESERQQFETALRRQEEMFKLELESKLRVNCDLSKLEVVQGEWQRRLEATVGQLEMHFKSVENLLDRQTLQVNGTNVELSKKVELLSGHYGRFEANNLRVGQLAEQMGELMPQFCSNQRTAECILSKLDESLRQVERQRMELEEQSKVVGARERELAIAREQLQEERLGTRLTEQRVSMREEQVEELAKLNSERRRKLNEQSNQQVERERQLQATRTSLDARSSELKEQNYDLHLLRKRLESDRSALERAEAELSEGRKWLEAERLRLAEESGKLEQLRARCQRELDQLGRLQKSLICSLCLSRLLAGQEAKQAAGLELNAGGDHLHSATDDTFGRLIPVPSRPDKEQQVVELVRLSRRGERESRQLAAESSYVRHLLAPTLD